MNHQGIYAGPTNNSPNRNRESIIKEEEFALLPTRLWVITYDLRGIGKGIAMVKAPNAEEANQILIANGIYNGSPQDYLITKTEEIVVPPCCGLMAEQTVEFFNNN